MCWLQRLTSPCAQRLDGASFDLLLRLLVRHCRRVCCVLMMAVVVVVVVGVDAGCWMLSGAVSTMPS